MPRVYRCVPQRVFTCDRYSLIPIRAGDQHAIRIWRNEQIEILRQREPLSRQDQTQYFKGVVRDLFNQDRPRQLLYSLLLDGALVGYGGLVHVDWVGRSAEMSFLTATDRAKNDDVFTADFTHFLPMILTLAFDVLELARIQTTFYDIRERQVYGRIIKEYKFVQHAHTPEQATVRGAPVDALTYYRLREPECNSAS